MQLSAQDPYGVRIQEDFNLTVTYFPEVQGTIPAQLADVDQDYQYTMASDTFSQADKAVLLYSVQQSSGVPLPGWLNFNSTSLRLKGTPNVTALGNYDLQMVATNSWGAQATLNFPLIVEHFPVVHQWLRPPLAGVGIAFNWVIPSDTFVDPDNELLTYTARQQGGSLPNWLVFNSRALTFSGVPQVTDIAVLPLTLSVTDSNGGEAQQSFNLTVTHFPQVFDSIPLQLANIDLPYLYMIPSDVFVEGGQSVLTYSAQQSSGLALPDWLRFNATMRQLSGRPNTTVAGRYGLEVMAMNPAGANASAGFSLIVEHFPEVLQSIPSPLADINSFFSFTVPPNSFIDRDGDLLTYTAQGRNGVSLPNWLAFNPQSLIFSGIPLETDDGTLPLQLTATDSVGATVATNLTIQVIHFPVLAHPASTMTFRAGQFFNFSLPQDTFTDQDQVGLSYFIQQPLPDWLAFKNQTLSFSGKPALGNIGTLSLILMATDTRGASASLNFQIVVRGDVPPAALEGSLSNQAATVGEVFSYFLPVPLFVDAYNNTLTYSAIQQDNSPLPGWLSFDNQSLHFAGTPGRGDTNFYATRTVGLKVSAQSDEGQAGINFDIIVGGVSWGQMAVNIGAPVVSILTTLFALYEARALLYNRCRHKKHTRNPVKTREGEEFQYEFKVKEVEHIFKVQVGIHNSARLCYEFFKPTYRLLPGGEQLPWWMEYNADRNLLYSKGVVPSGLRHTRLEVQAEDEDGIILDKFVLIIEPKLELKETHTERFSKDGDVESKKGKLTETKDEGVELQEITQSEKVPLNLGKTPSEGTLKDLPREDSIRINLPKNTPPSQKKELSPLVSQSSLTTPKTTGLERSSLVKDPETNGRHNTRCC